VEITGLLTRDEVEFVPGAVIGAVVATIVGKRRDLVVVLAAVVVVVAVVAVVAVVVVVGAVLGDSS